LGQGSYLLGWNLFRANKYTLVCKYLPKGSTPEGDSDQPVSQVPVLLFNGELDPLDPPANVAGWQKTWPNGLALTLPGRGHSISDYTSADCILLITSRFIEAGSAQNLPTECCKILSRSHLIRESRQMPENDTPTEMRETKSGNADYSEPLTGLISFSWELNTKRIICMRNCINQTDSSNAFQNIRPDRLIWLWL
jgi:hypothetical protein